MSSFRLQMFGLGAAIAGMAAVVTAWHLSSLAMMIAGSTVCGASIGMIYLGSISEINSLAPPEERGGVNSLYFMIVYLFFSIPTMALGFASTHLGLYTALISFAGIIAAFILMEMVWLAVRQRSANSG